MGKLVSARSKVMPSLIVYTWCDTVYGIETTGCVTQRVVYTGCYTRDAIYGGYTTRDAIYDMLCDVLYILYVII
jgi:hypothetical protein